MTKLTIFVYQHGKPKRYTPLLMTGPQGNDIIDYHSEYLQLFGDGKIYRDEQDQQRRVNGKHPPLVSTMKDRRDNRDPEEVGLAFLRQRYPDLANLDGGT